MNAPIQCSDDLAGSPDCQTGQEVAVADLQSATNARDLATDALADQRPQRPPAAPVAAAPRCAGDGGAQKSQDQVVITAPCPQPQPGPSHHIPSTGSPQESAVKQPTRGDTALLPGPSGTIHATGLAENLRPGAVLQIGHTNHMAVHHYADGSTRTTTAAAAPIPNRLKITENQAAPQQRHLNVVSQGLAGDWRSVGRRLSLTDTTLDQIWLDNKDYGLLEVNHRMLRKWIESRYPTSVHALAAALADTGHGDLADKLSQMN